MDQLTPEYREATLQRMKELLAQLEAVVNELVEILAEATRRQRAKLDQ